jgi:hypothetical protein
VGELTKADVLLRAGDLFRAVVEHAVKEGEGAMGEVSEALGAAHLAPFVACVGSADGEVGGVFAAAVGRFLGSKWAVKAAAQAGVARSTVAAQAADYVEGVGALLADAAADAGAADGGDDEDDAMSDAASVALSVGAPRLNSSLSAAGSAAGDRVQSALGLGEPAPAEGTSTGSIVGYVPTVSGIGADMPVGGAAMRTASDEHLGRLLAGLSAFLGRDENRVLFCTPRPAGRAPSLTPAGPSALAALLHRDVTLPVQATYQAVFCLWLLSFRKQEAAGGAAGAGEAASIVAAAMEDAGIPRRLTAVLREVHAEKVVRISLATLRNLMLMSTALRKEMVGAGLAAALESLCFRRWNDDDITEDLRVLADALKSELASMSTFDVYRAEVLSGALEWTPAHSDDAFWRENVDKMDSNNLEVLRCMVRLLNESTDTTVLSVACHDLAQFVKYHPRGRHIAQSLGVKGRLMELMASGDVEVRRYALNTVQVLMISNWSLMQRVA